MIYGLLGFKGSGKSTVAKYLEREHGFTIVSFKEPLVAELKQFFPDTLKAFSVIYNMSVDELFKYKPDGFRELMTDWGGFRRSQDPDYFVTKFKIKVASLMMQGIKNIVSDDTRYPNEVEAIKKWNGITIRIISDVVTSGGTHSSETSLIDYKADYTIHSIQGDFDKLYSDARKIVENSKSQD